MIFMVVSNITVHLICIVMGCPLTVDETLVDENSLS